MDRYTKFRDDRPIHSRVILGKPEGGCINFPPVPARVKDQFSFKIDLEN